MQDIANYLHRWGEDHSVGRQLDDACSRLYRAIDSGMQEPSWDKFPRNACDYYRARAVIEWRISRR